MTTAILNTKTCDVDNKILDNTSLVTASVLNTKINEVQNKVPDHPKYITTQEFNNLTAENLAARLKQANLVTKDNLDNNNL